VPPTQLRVELRFSSLFRFSSRLDSPLVGNNQRKSDQGETKKTGKEFHTVYLGTEMFSRKQMNGWFYLVRRSWLQSGAEGHSKLIIVPNGLEVKQREAIP
jgi:hypothetical protein